MCNKLKPTAGINRQIFLYRSCVGHKIMYGTDMRHEGKHGDNLL